MLKKEGLNPLKREYIIDKINLRRMQKDCLISYGANRYSVPSEYVGKDGAVVALGLITTKLRQTTAHSVAMYILALNLRKIQCALLRLLALFSLLMLPREKQLLFS